MLSKRILVLARGGLLNAKHVQGVTASSMSKGWYVKVFHGCYALEIVMTCVSGWQPVPIQDERSSTRHACCKVCFYVVLQ